MQHYKQFAITFALMVTSALITFSAFAQETGITHPAATARKVDFHYGAGVSISAPNGMKIEFGTNFIPELSLRAGLSFLPSIKLKEKEDEFTVKFDQYNATLLAQYQFKFYEVTGHLLLDYHPWKNGFRVTGGFFVGGFKAKGHMLILDVATRRPVIEYARGLQGSISDSYKAMLQDPVFDYQFEDEGKTIPGGDMSVRMADDSTVDAALKFKNALHPYLGIGYGYAVPKGRIGFSCDLGFYYTGGVSASSANVVKGDINAVTQYYAKKESLNGISKFVPYVNIGMTIRLY